MFYVCLIFLTLININCKKGVLCRTLEGHGHWVNTLALNSDYIIRTGAYDPKDATIIKCEKIIES